MDPQETLDKVESTLAGLTDSMFEQIFGGEKQPTELEAEIMYNIGYARGIIDGRKEAQE